MFALARRLCAIYDTVSKHLHSIFKLLMNLMFRPLFVYLFVVFDWLAHWRRVQEFIYISVVFISASWNPYAPSDRHHPSYDDYRKSLNTSRALNTSRGSDLID